MKNKTILNDKEVIDYYLNNSISTEGVALHFHVGKKKINDIFKRNGVEKKKKGGQTKGKTYVVNDWKVEKYSKRDGYHYEAWSKDGKFQTKDYMNQAGFLTTYIHKTYGVTPPNLYFRREYYKETGNYWWEQWFDIKLIKDKQTKKCPFCDWETTDVNNKSGAFKIHLLHAHDLTVEEYLKNHKEDESYFSCDSKSIKKNLLMVNPDNYVTCPICGDKMFRMTISHIRKHDLTFSEFKAKFPEFKMESEFMMDKDRKSQKISNTAERKIAHTSLAEKEICAFFDKNKISYISNDRKILKGKEIDILIPDYKLGIEYDGLRYHCEGVSNKTKDSQIEKTKEANSHGIRLIHIFEDEYQLHKELVFDKLRQAFNLNLGNIKIPARKCVVGEISSLDAQYFLNAFHLQGFAKSTIYIGGFYQGKLIGVMTFKKTGLNIAEEWELNRFATNFKYICQGLASKMLNYFIKKYNPLNIVSFADRRWTLNFDNNLYTKIGFYFSGCTRPNYTYFKLKYTKGEERYKRHHKLDFRRHILLKKYPDQLNDNMTEFEMATKLGYGRIWDCGLFKYVWYNKELIKN